MVGRYQRGSAELPGFSVYRTNLDQTPAGPAVGGFASVETAHNDPSPGNVFVAATSGRFRNVLPRGQAMGVRTARSTESYVVLDARAGAA